MFCNDKAILKDFIYRDIYVIRVSEDRFYLPNFDKRFFDKRAVYAFIDNLLDR